MWIVLVSLVLPALAFAPTDAAGVEPNRIQYDHLPEQLRMRHLPAWSEFLQAEGDGWLARFDELEHTPRRAWGPGIPLGAVETEAQVEAALRAFLQRYPGLTGVPDTELTLRSAGYVAALDMWYVDFDRNISGAPVWRGGVTARVRHGELVLFGAQTYPSVASLPKAAISMQTAEEIAQLDGPAAMADHADVTATLVALPWTRDGGLDVRLCWEVHSRTEMPLGEWVSHVDAATGELLNTYNEVRFFEGTVQGTHDTRTVDGSYTTSPMPLQKFTGADGTTVYADASGRVSLNDATTWTGALSGSYVTVRNSGGGGSGALVPTLDAMTWDTNTATQAEIDTYKFVHDVADWGQLVDPGNPMSTDNLVAKVNISSSCNAFYDGSINFYDEGNGCNNTGRIADVIYHEWGHGFHYYALESGSYDGSVSEGVGDIVSCLLTHDSRVGPYFYTSGGAIREVATDYVYPEDVTGETHQDGLIFAGAVWDLWEELTNTYGESRDDSGTAWLTASTLLAHGLHAGPTIPEAYDEFVLADDNNNDPTDGTPHMCELLESFGEHGLGPGGDSSLIGIDHTGLGNQIAQIPVLVEGTVVNLAPGCTEFTLAGAIVHYSTDDGENWTEVSGTPSGDDFSVSLPGFADGIIVNYYIEATAADGTVVLMPTGGDIAPYTFYVGGLTEVYCATFDDDDGGFTHALLDGRDQDGADDWVWDRPSGTSDDPVEAYSGNKVWGNDLGGGNYNGAYQPGIQNRLTSPEIDPEGHDELILQYRRWLNVEDGAYDQARILQGETEVWTNHATNENREDEATQDQEWMLHTVRLEGVPDPLVLAWELQTDGGLEFGGWNIDEVCVYAPAESTGSDNGGNGGDDGGNGGDNGGETGDNTKVSVNGGCGCASAPSAPWALGALALAAAGVRRRRG